MNPIKNAEHYTDVVPFEALRVFRGDVFVMTTPSGIERMVLVVSNDACNKFSNMVEVVNITTALKKPLPTHVQIMLNTSATVQCEAVNTVYKDRLGKWIRRCSPVEMEAINEALMISLGIEKKEPEKQAENMDTVQPQAAESINEELIKARTAMSLYKKLYEQLLEKLTTREGG